MKNVFESVESGFYCNHSYLIAVSQFQLDSGVSHFQPDCKTVNRELKVESWLRYRTSTPGATKYWPVIPEEDLPYNQPIVSELALLPAQVFVVFMKHNATSNMWCLSPVIVW